MLAYRNPDRKKVRHSNTVRFAVRLNLTVIQVSRGRGRRLRSARPRLASVNWTCHRYIRRALGGGACTCCATHTPLMRRRAPCHCARTRSNVSPLGRVHSFCHPLSLHVRVPLSASDGSRHPNDGGACALKDCCTPRSPRVHVKSIARINGCMSA